MPSYTVYILQCGKGEFYTGYTKNLARRLADHRRGKASRFTRSRLPVKLVYSKRLKSRKQAMLREIQIKRLPRQRKLLLLEAYSKRLDGQADKPPTQ